MEAKGSATSSKSIKATSKRIPPQAKRQIHPVIEIVNGSKHYGWCGHLQQVLRKFNISVYGGEVYALLGPHGCGKSTVLNVILGLKTLDSGLVTIFGFKPGHELSGIPGIRVGYTPQSSGLYPEFTVSETLQYYGALLELKRSYISQRISFLSNLLAIPSDKQFIKHCTAGTKRQISFAVALLHEPEVLILDEPCAGIDPLLRRSMWEHMRELAKDNTTILVTTQSCEEARMADKIGFMRHGHLLIDGNPRELLLMYKEKLLESLYRRVYSSNNLQPQKSTASIEENPLIKLEPLNVTSSEGFLYTGEAEPSNESIIVKPRKHGSRVLTTVLPVRKLCGYCFSCKRLCVLLTRDFIRSVRNYMWLMLFLLLPSFFLMVFCITIGTTPSSLILAVVNHEASEEDCMKNHDHYLSCQVLDLIDEYVIVQRKYHSDAEAWKAAKNLEVSAILVINKKFTTYINKALAALVLGKDDSSVDPPPIVLSLDVTSRIVANTIESTIKTAVETYLHKATKNTKVEGAGLGYPVKVGTPIFGTDKTIDTDYMAPGLAITFTYHMAAFIAAITLVSDRVNKITQRNYLAGVHLQETVISQMIVYGLITMLQAVLLFVMLLVVFDMPNNGSLLYITLIVIVQIWCGLSFGILLAMISRSSVVAGLCVFCCIVATLILCGIHWPLYGLPRWLKIVIEFLPQTKCIQAVRTILQRGTSITHKHVWFGIAVPVCWLCIFTLGYSFTNRII